MREDSLSQPEWTSRPSTAPEAFVVSCRGFATEEHAQRLGRTVGEHIRALSRIFNLCRLDGVTVAYDYAEALLGLDVGYATNHQLKPSEGDVVGIAMTPTVLREGVLKSHIVLNAAFVEALEQPDNDSYRQSLHTLAHECAHVETSFHFDTAFPGTLRRKTVPNARLLHRWNTFIACWDEYSATRLSAGIGHDPTNDYENTFIARLADTRDRANKLITAYRLHGNVDQILDEIYCAYGNLLKFTAYHLGNLDGAGIDVMARSATVNALRDHWFEPYFHRMKNACQNIARNEGQWKDLTDFEAIGDLLDDLVNFGGLTVSEEPDGSLYVDIPFTWETMP